MLKPHYHTAGSIQLKQIHSRNLCTFHI